MRRHPATVRSCCRCDYAASSRCSFRTALSGVVSTVRPVAAATCSAADDRLNCARATTSQLFQCARRLGRYAIMLRRVASVQRRQRVRRECGHQRHARCHGGELRRHRRQCRCECGQQSDAAGGTGLGHCLIDHRLVGLQHRHWREFVRTGIDAWAEGRAGEQNAVRAARHGVAGERQKAIGHRRCQRTITGEVSRQPIVQQVGQFRVGPKAREGCLDRGDGVLQGVDQRDTHRGSGCWVVRSIILRTAMAWWRKPLEVGGWHGIGRTQRDSSDGCCSRRVCAAANRGAVSKPPPASNALLVSLNIVVVGAEVRKTVIQNNTDYTD